MRIEKIECQGGPGGLVYSALVHYNSSLYLIGGYFIDKDEAVYNEKIYKLPLGTFEWEIVEFSGSLYNKILSSGLLSKDTIYLLQNYDNNNSFIYCQFFNITQQLVENCSLEIETVLYSATAHNDLLYVFGGLNYHTVFYSSELFVIDPISAKVSEISEYYEIPDPRNFASLVTIENSLYLFGGSSENIKFYNDLWQFSLTTETWTKIDTLGTAPDPRSDFGCTRSGYRMFVYGGKALDYYNDLYEYNSFTNTWKSLDSDIEVKPASRSGACIVYYNDSIYIYGGSKDSTTFTDFWQFNIKTSQYSTLTPGPYSDSCNYCRIDPSKSLIYILSSPSSYTLKKVTVYNINSDSWQVIENNSLRGVGSTNFLADSKLISIGGRLWDSHLKKSITILDINTYKSQSYTIDIGFFGSAVAHYSDSLYLFGGVFINGNFLDYANSTNTLVKLNLNQILNSTYCSPGTYIVNKTCVVCPSGKYSNLINSEKCSDCPKGSFSKISAATSVQQCMPCGAGSWNNQTGQSFCRDCPSNFFCPYGSSYPSEFLVIGEDSSSQPESFKEQTSKYSYYSTLVYALIAALFSLGLIGVTFFTKIRQKLYLVDIYTNLHNHKHLVPMYVKKTNLGGCCSLVFLASACAFILITVIRYELLNIVEVRTLVPLITISETFKANLEFEVNLYYYGGDCEESNECISNSKLEYSGLSGELSRSCKKYDQTCTVNLKCNECEVYTTSSVLLEFFEEYSFCSFISVNLTSTTSIPGMKSTVRLFTTSDSSTYFKGSDPTIFTFNLIPTLFKSGSVDDSGYHISKDIPVIQGSQYKSESFSYGSGLSVEINLDVSNTCLHISRDNKVTQAELFSALIGTVFGFLSSIGGLMNYSEKYYENLSAWLYRKSALRHYYRRIKRIMSIIYQGNRNNTYSKAPSLFSQSKFGGSESFYDDQTLFRSRSTIK